MSGLYFLTCDAHRDSTRIASFSFLWTFFGMNRLKFSNRPKHEDVHESPKKSNTRKAQVYYVAGLSSKGPRSRSKASLSRAKALAPLDVTRIVAALGSLFSKALSPKYCAVPRSGDADIFIFLTA